MRQQLERVRGTNDWSPQDARQLRDLVAALGACFASYGYEHIEVPVLEHTDLFRLKSGEDILTKLYAFPYRGRDLCLRPELTASVGRYYVDRCQAAALPQRFAYAGPVFRYERPRQGRYRQFTQAGVELIGPEGPVADAELAALAWQSLARLGLDDHRLEIGHFGVMAALLRTLGLDDRARSFVIASMQDLRKAERGRAQVDARLTELFGSGAEDQSPGAPDLANAVDHRQPDDLLATLRRLVAGLDEQRARELILGLLQASHVSVGRTRSAEDVAAGLLRKLRWQDQAPGIRRALELAERLRAVRGNPPEAFDRIRHVLTDYRLDHAPLHRLEAISAQLGYYGVPPKAVTINLGLGRGLPYYTGMVFEIYADRLGPAQQLCGGGRYDGLLRLLGANTDVPAAGFAFGVERVKLALDSHARTPARPTTQVQVIPLGAEDYAYAVTAAEQLRQAGLRVELELMERGVKGTLRQAARRGIPFCGIVGPKERLGGTITVRNMAAHQEQRVALTDAARYCQADVEPAHAGPQAGGEPAVGTL